MRERRHDCAQHLVSVCALVCVSCTCRTPNPEGRCISTAKRPHTPAHHLPSSTNLPRGGQLRIRGSTARRSLCKPLLSAVSWIWSCECQKNSEATRQDEKTTCGTCLKLHAANFSTWRAPRNSEKCRETVRNRNSRKKTKRK